MNLYDIYKSILGNSEMWNPSKINIHVDFPNVFIYPHSYNYLLEVLFYDSSFRDLIQTISQYRESIPAERYAHTVSLYLLGIYVADYIGYEKFKLDEWDKDPKRNFIHHWAAICLFHDIGYFIEEAPNKFLPKSCKSINTVKRVFQIEYDVTKIEGGNLIKRYFRYRASQNKMDHGIIASRPHWGLTL